MRMQTTTKRAVRGAAAVIPRAYPRPAEAAAPRHPSETTRFMWRGWPLRARDGDHTRHMSAAPVREAAQMVAQLHGIVPEEKLLRLAAFAGE